MGVPGGGHPPIEGSLWVGGTHGWGFPMGGGCPYRGGAPMGWEGPWGRPYREGGEWGGLEGAWSSEEGRGLWGVVSEEGAWPLGRGRAL